MNLMAGFTVNCPESPETVQRDLRELGPTTVLAPPRIWENMLTGVQVRAADSPPLKRWVFERCRRGAERAEILAALVNAVSLIVLAIYIFWEAFQRIGEPLGLDVQRHVVGWRNALVAREVE